MENFDPNSTSGAEYKSPSNETDDKKDKSESKSSKKSSFEVKSIWQEPKESKATDGAPAEKPSLLGGLVSREAAPEQVEAVEGADDAAEAGDEGNESIQDLEVMSSDESRQVVETIIADRQASATAELSGAQTGSPEEVEAAASSALFDAVQEHLDDDVDAEQAIDMAAEEILAEIDDMAAALPESEELAVNTPEAEQDDDEEDPVTPIPLQATAQAVPPPLPVMPPAVMAAPIGGGPNGPNIPNIPNVPGDPNSLPPTPNVMPVPTPVESRRNRAGDMLLGGVIGYLIGRRRGRIKTEKRMQPIQEKLERQVKDLQESINEKEFEVRTAAREKLAPKITSPEQKHPAAQQLVVEQETKRLTKETTAQVAPEKQSHPALPEQPELPRPERVTAPEAKVDWKIAPFTEVLAMAFTIEVQVKNQRRNIRELFERGSISKEEVRRLVVEYSRGASPELLRPRLIEIDAAELQPGQGVVDQHEKAQKPLGTNSGEGVALNAELPMPQPQDDTQILPTNNSAEVSTDSKASPQPESKIDKSAKTAIIAGATVGLIIALSLLLLLK